MVIDVAGVTAEVHCRCIENECQFEDYVTDKPPVLKIAPTDADIQNMQALMDSRARRRDAPLLRYPEKLLEMNIIYRALCETLIDHDVLPIHGSALCMDGAAYVFIAPGNTGKSTHSRLWREVYGDRVWMINDDKPLLKVTDGGIMVCGFPWIDKQYAPGCNASAPLKAIVRLFRDNENHIESLSNADGFQMLLTRSYPYLFRRSLPQDAACMAHSVALAKRVVCAAECYSLGCNMSPEAAIVSHDGMNAGKI